MTAPKASAIAVKMSHMEEYLLNKGKNWLKENKRRSLLAVQKDVENKVFDMEIPLWDRIYITINDED
jgi:hypothetical protein